MSSTASSSNSGGIGVAGLLGVAFVILKLCGVIDWPWIWVLAPFWVGLVIVLGVMAIIGLVWLVAKSVNEIRGTRR